MGAIVEDSLESLLAGDHSDFTQRRAAILETAYESYRISTDFRQDSPSPSSIDLLPSSEVLVLISRCPETEAATDLHLCGELHRILPRREMCRVQGRERVDRGLHRLYRVCRR
ncbi:hypothetical protein LB505_008827 [Fusarium chuoi]|nr:hypothetical protein LB505_008827 [Fusarium chuoi]